jgi:adenine deaminase
MSQTPDPEDNSFGKMEIDSVNLKILKMQSIVSGNLIDIFRNEIYPAEVIISAGRIASIKRNKHHYSKFILPGLIDSHIHIESSMLTPAGFAKIAVRHGTVGVVSDPHEIANVMGEEGVSFMIENGRSVPLKFFFGAPSCVPATEYETGGGRIDYPEVEKLLMRDDIYFLSEVMNYPAVIRGDKEIMKKIGAAKRLEKPVDGHAPGLVGDDLKKYAGHGIETDHECITLSEAEEKISAGMKIQIREGSAAKGFDLLAGLIGRFPSSVMLCTDDLHPDDLIKGHINRFLARGVEKGLNIFDLVRCATLNPVLHYNLPVGLLREGDSADLIIVDDLKDFSVSTTYINGVKVYDGGSVLFNSPNARFTRKFRTDHIGTADICPVAEKSKILVIRVNDGELYTNSEIHDARIENGFAVSDPDRDICKIVVVNKYNEARPSVGFITGFGIKSGAIAGSIAHDSHNIIAVGIEDDFIVRAINTVIRMQGGLSVSSSKKNISMQLEIGGLMTSKDGIEVARKYQELDFAAKQLGSALTAPFMSLSFMALLVIPELKIGDRGLFDVNKFNFTSLFT